MKKLCTLEQAVDMIPNNATVNITGSGGGLMDAENIYEGIEKKFLECGEPNHLSLMHVTGVGRWNETGVGRFAHKGLVKRVIGGHWLWSKRMAQLAEDEEIEAYNLPQGVLSKLTREIASGQPGLLTTVGLNTFIDPRIQGGKLNDSAKEDLVELLEFKGSEMLFYKSYPIDVAIIRGSIADEDGNISTEFEAVDLEILSAAQAAYNSGGIVIAQVKRLAQRGTLNPRMVRVPGHMVNAIVVNPDQWQTGEAEFNPALCGTTKLPLNFIQPLESGIRKVVARRAARELQPGFVVNLGIGMSDGVANVVAEEGRLHDYVFSVEQGIVGGVPVKGLAFGAGWNPSSIIAMCEQFDFYHGGGLDMTCLGMAQVDQLGNVNVSRFGKKIPGSGGFIDISQNSKRVTFCGSFTSGGGAFGIGNGNLEIKEDGTLKKFLSSVEQITFSSKNALENGQKVLYVTERAVFELKKNGLCLIEIAPGVDLTRDILANMDFKPEISDNLKQMDSALFAA